MKRVAIGVSATVWAFGRRESIYMRGTKTVAVRALVIVLVALALLILFAKVAPSWLQYSLTSSIQSFVDAPSQSTADELVRSLDNQQASAEQGNEILSLLTAPRAVVRSSYSMDRSVVYLVTCPARLTFRNMILRHTVRRSSQGVECRGDSSTGANTYGPERMVYIDPQSAAVADQLKHGPQTVTILEEQTIDVIPAKRTAGEQAPALYSCTSRLCIPIHFVAEPAVEPVHVFTCPELEEKMRSAFALVPASWSSAGSRPQMRGWGAASARVSGTTSIGYRCLPADVAFALMFRDEQGRLLELFDTQAPGSLLKAYAGTSGRASGFMLNLDFPEFPLAQGNHAGHLVLVPCPKWAYNDPRLVNIWGGTLEFPMTLTVESRN